MTTTALRLNGQPTASQSPPDTPLLWVLREELGLTGSKYGCGAGLCGACTVHLDGVATRSCVLPLQAAAARPVTTIEGLASREGQALMAQWTKLGVAQCGYCQSGMVMAAAALLTVKPKPVDEDIDAAITNLCRCGTYPRVRQAIHAAAAQLAAKT
ncbi:MAG: (2Fe-2S)-binding protein [Rubrivivax sp.]|jgi:isoquinoline 1-oxidoreductase alpha subunit|nr:(2Fe-2S)-binding protein [Rubrivivax sp.]